MMSSGIKNIKPKTTRYNLIVPLLIILGLMIVMVAYTSRLINRVAISNIHEVGEDRISGIAAQMENYLDTTKNVLWVTADTVDHMIRNGSTAEQILQYMTEESQNQEEQFDENYTGIYGYIMGEYLDGAGWEPPEGYNPKERTWYQAAIEADGESTIVSPYVDLQTNSVIISISRMLSSGRDVLSMDVMMNRIQGMTKDLQVKGKGHGFILNYDGMIIAHNDETQNGSYLTETEEDQSLFDRILETKNGYFETALDGKKCTVFSRQILNQWYIVIVVSNAELYAEVWQQLAVNVLICLIIFTLVALFYYLGHKNEQNYARRMEELKTEEQRKAYETKVLKLEMEAADQANKAKSDFLAEMSHEIRTPINAVLGMNEMILRESEQALETAPVGRQAAAFHNIRIYAGNIGSAGNNLLSIINDILDFSKIEAGRLEIVPGNYELSSVLNDVSNIACFRAQEKGLDFQVDVDETIPDGLYGDEVRIRQVITNLLGNALKYTNRGSVRLEVRCETEVIEDGRPITLIVAIRDTGIGIREEDQKKLFTKFQRVDLQRNSTVEGTGLGLAITQSLVDMMGGEIRVESTYGVGSVFTVLLPQKIVSCEPVGNFQTKFEKNVLVTRVCRDTFRAPEARILIVDDTRMNLTVATGLLKSTEIRIDTAAGGREAIEYARTTPYDLILMDQRMPKMDGTEALHKIREQKDGENRETPVICLTADAVIGAKERYLSEGFTDYLTKPIDSKALEKLLLRYLPAEKIIPVKMEEHTETAAAATGTMAAAGMMGATEAMTAAAMGTMAAAGMMSATEATAAAEAAAAKEAGNEKRDRYALLQAAGVQPETGLGYCQGDETFYKSLLMEYAQSAKEKAPDLQQYYQTQNWKEYAILVHALKSSSKIIGAVSLSETAAQLESAANHGDEAAIRKRHQFMMDQYDAVANTIRTVFGGEEFPADVEEEILEFLPEE